MENFEKRLLGNYDSLTKSHQLLAKYLFENMDKAVFLTALQIAKDVDLSETTVIRLAYRLGYDSFSSMHKAMQAYVLANKNKQITTSVQGAENITADLCEKHHEYLYRIFNNLENNIFKDACDLMMSSERILIMGYKDSYGMAVELMRLLEKVRPKVYFHRWMRDRNEIVYDMAKDSLMITVSFSPHSKFTVAETEFMKKIGCKVIAFTDSAVNPFRHVADHNFVFELPRDDSTGFVNISPAVNFFDYMAKYLYENYKEDIDIHMVNLRKFDEEYL